MFFYELDNFTGSFLRKSEPRHDVYGFYHRHCISSLHILRTAVNKAHHTIQVSLLNAMMLDFKVLPSNVIRWFLREVDRYETNYLRRMFPGIRHQMPI